MAEATPVPIDPVITLSSRATRTVNNFRSS